MADLAPSLPPASRTPALPSGTSPSGTSSGVVPSGGSPIVAASGAELATARSDDELLEGLSGPHKAMLLLVSLDEDVATRVIANLQENEVAELRRATESLREVPHDTLLAVHRDFIQRVRGGLPQSLQGSGAYLRRLVGAALGEGKAAELWKDRRGVSKASSSAFQQIEPAMLAVLLDDEHPQTVAVVLSQLETGRAVEVLQKMNPARKSEILQRLGRLESVPESVLDAIETEFTGAVARLGEERRLDVKGKDAAANILKRMLPDDSNAILEEVAQTDEEVAGILRQALFTFEDLLRIEGRGMQQLLKEVPTDQLVLALKTASDELKEKVFGNLSSRAAEMLREDLQLLGPTRLADVENAQRTIVDAALELEKEGRITIAREGGGDLV